MATYAFLDGGRIACVAGRHGIDRLGILDGGRLDLLELPYTAFLGPYLASDGRRVAAVASGPADPSAVVVIDPDPGLPDGPRVDVVRRSLSIEVDPALVPEPEAIEFPTAGGLTAHALYYPPTNPSAAGPDGERPPLLVNSHGGPTGQTPAMFSLGTMFWTSRGFGVVHVNYGGSTGYGREYRRRLDGRWGIVDTHDCIAAARYLADRGSVDPDRLAIRGGSAGGYTTLCALTFHDDFAAGVSSFGVADPAALAAETHKFESRYLDGLIGPWPEAEQVYRERSPIHHTEGLNCPILLLQGLEDKVVPPSQAEAMAKALKAKGVPFALLAFEGEQHGFRQVATIRRAYEAELSFYGQVFDFTPAGELPALELVR
jgi:dipeptidyl aminopeptidase/acylaminoacyl peptidase